MNDQKYSLIKNQILNLIEMERIQKRISLTEWDPEYNGEEHFRKYYPKARDFVYKLNEEHYKTYEFIDRCFGHKKEVK